MPCLVSSSIIIAVLCVIVIGFNTSVALNRNCDSANKAEVYNLEEARKKKEDLMSKILPMLAMPFIMSTTFLPMMITSMKIMLMNSMILGKLAIFLGALTILRNMLKNRGGLFSHNVNVQSHPHDVSRSFEAEKWWKMQYLTRKRAKRRNKK